MSKIRVWSAFSRHKHVGPFMKEPIYRHAGRKKNTKKNIQLLMIQISGKLTEEKMREILLY